MNGNRSSHEDLGTKGRRRGIIHHLSLLRGERFLKNHRNPRSAFRQATNFGSPWAVLSVVILLTNETRIFGFALSSFLGWRFGGFLFRLLGFIFSFSLFLSFRGLIHRGGLDGVNLRSTYRIRTTLRSVLASIWFWLPRVRG